MRFLLSVLILFLLFLFYGFLPVKADKTVDIPYGMSTPQMAMYLYEQGLLRTPLSFLLLHVVVKGKLEAGEYEFKGWTWPWDVYRKIRYGLKKTYKITIPEGSDIYDIARILENNGITKGEDFLKWATSPQVAKKYGLRVYGMEGFLFPDTYFFSRNTHPLTIIDTMYHNFLRRTKPLREELLQKGMSLEEWVTVASMIEKETAVKEEKPLVAAVIYNRIKRGMKLQIDPTVIYALKRKNMWDGKLTLKDLKIDDPYNTYLYPGLPPTPICNPGLDSLEAALRPAKVDYLYFVANGEGGHFFSVTYEDHLKKVNLYRQMHRQ
ncbi:aminodeoxychorismate lyase [Thermocrinis albus DSM 14484]|uniref:Endolytic murein transglycosylase n=1 Tax=Thermocrinis albus (strain DSM 14484 / JCM 11386 / HI 11/12) TaxID=638303 RepID=D3SNP7_THEAH|nr:endolytic transglycosylase MltG [Thermocrinis albus]ADC88784.1 aminodeoxychorismate lyase [Thermocrinis albus DSM 14484]